MTLYVFCYLRCLIPVCRKDLQKLLSQKEGFQIFLIVSGPFHPADQKALFYRRLKILNFIRASLPLIFEFR